MTTQPVSVPSDTTTSPLPQHNVSEVGVSFDPAYFYASGACMLVIGVMGIVGNFLLLCVMKRPHLKNKSYAHYLSALAVSDSINIFFLFFQYINSLVKVNAGLYLTSAFHNAGCRVFDFVEHIFIFNSAWLIVCITVERFLVIYFRCRGRIFCRAKRALTVVVAVALVSCSTQAIRPYWVVLSARGTCTFRMDGGEALATGFDIFFEAILFYLIPSMTILVLNILTLIRMNSFLSTNSSTTVATTACASGYRQAATENDCGHATCTTGSSTSGGPGSGVMGHPVLLKYFPRLRRNSRRATMILLSISFTYMICCLPHLLGDLYWHIKIVFIGGVTRQDETAFFNYVNRYRYVLKVFRVLNYGSNFYTYMLFGKSFRREVTTLLNFSSSSGAAGAMQALPMIGMGPDALPPHYHPHQPLPHFQQQHHHQQHPQQQPPDLLAFNHKANGAVCCCRDVSDNFQPLLTPQAPPGEHLYPVCYTRMPDIPN